MTNFNSIFSERSDSASSNRIAFIAIVLVACFLTVYMILLGREVVETTILFTSMTGTGIGLKAAGKGQENQRAKIERSRQQYSGETL